MSRIAILITTLALAFPAFAQDTDRLSVEDILQTLAALDPDARSTGVGIELTIEDVPVLVIIDPVNDRMRAMVPIRSVSDMDEADFRRVLQANFDTALDARYAIAQGKLWGVFIHPLSPLERNELISGIGQSVNLALSYGTAYSSGAVGFGAGDSGPILRNLIDRLLDKGQAL